MRRKKSFEIKKGIPNNGPCICKTHVIVTVLHAYHLCLNTTEIVVSLHPGKILDSFWQNNKKVYIATQVPLIKRDSLTSDIDPVYLTFLHWVIYVNDGHEVEDDGGASADFSQEIPVSDVALVNTQLCVASAVWYGAD